MHVPHLLPLPRPLLLLLLVGLELELAELLLLLPGWEGCEAGEEACHGVVVVGGNWGWWVWVWVFFQRLGGGGWGLRRGGVGGATCVCVAMDGPRPCLMRMHRQEMRAAPSVAPGPAA